NVGKRYRRRFVRSGDGGNGAVFQVHIAAKRLIAAAVTNQSATQNPFVAHQSFLRAGSTPRPIRVYFLVTFKIACCNCRATTASSSSRKHIGKIYAIAPSRSSSARMIFGFCARNKRNTSAMLSQRSRSTG